MAFSQNGRSVPLTAAQRSATLTYITLPGGRLEVRKGDVATIFEWFVVYYNAHVQGLIWPGNWGFYARPIRGMTSGYSNHASGTAIDLNAPLHPRGTRAQDNFSASQIAEIRRMLAYCDDVLRWGADYVGAPPDPMHFEINASDARVHALALKIRADAKPALPAITGDKVLLLINDGQEHTFLTDGVQMRWIKSNDELAYVRFNMAHHFDSPNVTNYKVTPAQVPYFGVIVGDNPYTPAVTA